MELRYLFDTNIFLNYLIDSPDVQEYFSVKFIEENEILISNIVKLELLSYREISESQEKVINELLKLFTIIPLSNEIEEVTINIEENID